MKIKFRLLLLLSLFICLFATLEMQAQIVKQHGQLHVTGTNLMDKNNTPIVLRGMSLGWHNLWPRFYNAGAVAFLKNDWKVTVIRAAMGVELNDSGYIKSPLASKNHIVTVVDAAIKHGIYVIIDWHSHNINLNEAKTFFSEMAQKYSKYPNVIYELFNEPDQESWDEVKTYASEIIKVIRQHDPNNVILVGNPHWDQDIHLVADSPLTGFTNIMYTMHFYAATHKQFLRDRSEYALKKGIPIFISECAGMEASGDGVIDYKEWDIWIDWAEKNKLSWLTWSVSDKKEKCSVLLPSAKSNGNWKEADLNETGKYARKLLRGFVKQNKK